MIPEPDEKNCLMLTSTSIRHNITQCAARLDVTTIWIDVDVSYWLLDANADAQGLPCVRVQDIHKVCVIWRKSPV